MSVVSSIQLLYSLLTSNTVTVGTSAVQLSGGTAALAALGGVAASRNRQAFRITNTSATQTLYLGSASGVTTASGGGWFKVLNLGESYESCISGSVPLYIISTAAGGSATVEELA